MRYLLLSDVHGNVVALDAVLEDARLRGYDEVLFLGDAVGYYPRVEEVIARLVDLAPKVSLVGNHDAWLLDVVAGRPLMIRAASVVGPILEKQAASLSSDSLAWLQRLDESYRTETFEAVHAAYARPWQYMHGLAEAEENLPHMTTRLCLIGHTHVPRVLASTVGPGGHRMWRQVPFHRRQGRYRLPAMATAFFNPGAVGQPRDAIPLAAYGLFDDTSFHLDVIRVPYDVAAVQQEALDAGYPERVADRLISGT